MNCQNKTVKCKWYTRQTWMWLLMSSQSCCYCTRSFLFSGNKFLKCRKQQCVPLKLNNHDFHCCENQTGSIINSSTQHKTHAGSELEDFLSFSVHDMSTSSLNLITCSSKCIENCEVQHPVLCYSFFWTLAFASGKELCLIWRLKYKYICLLCQS